MDFSLSADDLLRLLSTSSLATTVERVQAAIERAVALGIFPHGRLPAERKLSTALGVSRSAIRAGLEAVRESGYIENSLLGRSGGAPTRVSPLLPSAEISKRAIEAQAEIRELMSTRQIVEPSCARAAAKSNDQVLIDRMIESQRVLAEERSALAHRVTDSDFHLAVAFASRSKEAIGVVLRTRADLMRWRDRLPMVDRIDETLAGHEEILEAVINGDGAAAAAAMFSHLQATKDLFDSCLESYFDASGGTQEPPVEHSPPVGSVPYPALSRQLSD